jgi:hypothetical protein
MLDEEELINDTPPYDTHNNNTVTIEGGYYLFNMMIISVLGVGILRVCCKSMSRARQYINETRQTSSLDSYLLSHQDKDEDAVGSCAICIEAFTSTKTNTTLQCNHTFHTDCIKEWLEKELTCPICRQVLLLN